MPDHASSLRRPALLRLQRWYIRHVALHGTVGMEAQVPSDRAHCRSSGGGAGGAGRGGVGWGGVGDKGSETCRAVASALAPRAVRWEASMLARS